ncbi:hypothetical protein ACOME3_004657 [Neoechinorhynchus agilis]
MDRRVILSGPGAEDGLIVLYATSISAVVMRGHALVDEELQVSLPAVTSEGPSNILRKCSTVIPWSRLHSKRSDPLKISLASLEVLEKYNALFRLSLRIRSWLLVIPKFLVQGKIPRSFSQREQTPAAGY